MSDNLRDRITKAIADAQFAFDNGDPYNGPEDADVLADAVIAALGLKREETLFSLLPDYEINVVRTNVWATRYVTEWEPDETD